MSSTKTASGFSFQFLPGSSRPRRPLNEVTWTTKAVKRPLKLRLRHREEVKRWKKRNPEKAREYARRNYRRNRAKFCARSRKNYRQNKEIRLRADLKRRYNVSLEAYKALLAEQNGVCAICGEPEKGRFSRLSVDHDHSTNKIRGLLCSACNSGLGRLKDSKELLIRALEYLFNAELVPNSSQAGLLDAEAKDGRNRTDDNEGS